MFIQYTTPDTSTYMIAGYTIFFVLMIVYLISLFIRTRNLDQDLTILKSIQEQSPTAPVRPASGPRSGVKRKTTRPKTSKPAQIKRKVTRKK
jgi:hypothetical protein